MNPYPTRCRKKGAVSMSRPKVLSLLTREQILRVCSEEDFGRLCEEFDVTLNPGPEAWPYEQVVARIPPYEAMLTGWEGSPELKPDFYEAAPHLRLVAHLAGTVRHLIKPAMIEAYLRPRGIIVFSARAGLAWNVSESVVGLLIATSRRWFEHWLYLREGGRWRAPHLEPESQHLLGSTLGILGASQVGRHLLRLLGPWEMRRLLYDPYLSADEAAELGAEKVELEDLFRRATHVADCLPSTEETRGLVSAELLARLRDGAVFVNCARGATVDMEALITEAQSGRLLVAVDVTDPEEPPPLGSPMRTIPNFYLLPHVAGCGTYGYQLVGRGALQALRDCFAGRPVEGAVDYDRFEQLA
jgi:phosphoglycerate dehydrogenase-like enzyme